MFVLSKVLWFFVAPGNVLVILVVLGAIALLVRWWRIGTVLVTLAAVAMVVIMATPLSEWVLAPLENRFPAMTRMPAHVDGIILVGGAVDPVLSFWRRRPQVNGDAERVIATAALARRYPDARILITGGNGSLWRSALNEADPTRRILLSLGVPAARITLEKRSRNTFENAEFSYALIHPKPGSVWLLVTSANHMPRAVGCFRHVGWKVVPYVVDYRTAPHTRFSWIFSRRLQALAMGTHEWIGLVAYWMMGRIDHVFPAP